MCEIRYLGQLCEISTGNNNRDEACNNGKYPFFVRSKDVLAIDNYSYNENAVIIPGEGAVGDVFHYVNGKYGLHQRAYRIHPNTSSLNCRYLYYYMFCNFKSYILKKTVGATSLSIRKPMLEQFVVVVPHIKVQEEIVKILDSFTNLIDALNEELSLRQKQFEYYREKLLTFDDSVKRIKLEDIGFFYGGLSGKTKNDFIEGNKKFVSYMNVFTNSTICLDINDKVKISDGETQNKIAYGDILFTGSSETPNECGMSSVVTTEIDEEIYLNSFCFGYRFNNLDGICPKFFSFLLRSTSMRNEISKTANGVTRFNVSKKLLAKVNVFIPSLKVQQSIVTKLDAFESLISSLKEEIALRQKQYEYYREKLLTFE